MQQRGRYWEGKAKDPDIVCIFSLSAALSELRRGLHGGPFLTALKALKLNAGRCMPGTCRLLKIFRLVLLREWNRMFGSPFICKLYRYSKITRGMKRDRLCGLVVRVIGNRSGGPGSIPGTNRKNNLVGLERGPLSLVSTTEELLDRKVAAPV
jgi:hypothetical protein